MIRRKNFDSHDKRTSAWKMKKYMLLAVGVVLVISSVFMTVETATSGVEVSNLRQKQRELSMEKRNLEGTLVRSLSINGLEEKSSEMGYVKPNTMVYVSQSQEAMAKLP